MKQLVLNGGIEGSCDAERFMLDQNDNDVKLILDVEENGNPGKLVCKIFFATQFEAIRMVRDAANYELSLSVCKVQDVHGGKSGADFFITGDRRYLVKVISAREFEMFVTNAHSYFESVICFEVICRYLAKSFFHGLPSLLCKVLGIYQTVFTDSANRKTVSHYVVMENLFFNKKIAYKFDLKGSNRNRYVNEMGKSGAMG